MEETHQSDMQNCLGGKLKNLNSLSEDAKDFGIDNCLADVGGSTSVLCNCI